MWVYRVGGVCCACVSAVANLPGNGGEWWVVVRSGGIRDVWIRIWRCSYERKTASLLWFCACLLLTNPGIGLVLCLNGCVKLFK